MLWTHRHACLPNIFDNLFTKSGRPCYIKQMVQNKKFKHKKTSPGKKVFEKLLNNIVWYIFYLEASPVQVEIPEKLITEWKEPLKLYYLSIGDSEQKVRCNIPHNELYILRRELCYVPQCAKKWFIYTII